MIRYIIKRLVYAVLTLFVLISLTFFMMRMLPGDPFIGDKTVSATAMANMNAKYGLDKPVFVQYLMYMGNCLRGDLGISITYNRDVMTIISGVNCENTAESIEMAKEAKEAGADGILLMPPHMWLRFGMNPNAPFEYIKDVAEGADIDIIIHLYPATSKAFYPVETLIKMCKEIDHVKCIKMGTRVTSIYEHDVRLLRQECPDISLITCHDETLCVSWFPGMDGALIGFAGCVPELICPAWDVFSHPEKHTLKEAQDWSNRIYHISQAIYGGGQPSGEAHARLKEALYQRGIFTSALMRKPVLPLNQEEKAWVSLGLERSQLPKVDMEQYK